MVYGICRERFGEEDFAKLKQELDLADLTERDPEAAQEMLNDMVE